MKKPRDDIRSRPLGQTGEISEIDASKVKIRFNSHVLAELKRLEKALEGKDEFDYDAFVLLQSLASGRPLPVSDAISRLTAVCRDVMAYYHKTGDLEARRALNDTCGQLIGDGRSDKPMNLQFAPKVQAQR
jgi:hypothetical protein